MPIFVFYVEQFLKSIKWLLFISILFGQPKPKIVHTDVISESEKMEATFIFDEVIDRDDVSGWIDRNYYFTLSLFNVSFDAIISYSIIGADVAPQQLQFALQSTR